RSRRSSTGSCSRTRGSRWLRSSRGDLERAGAGALHEVVPDVEHRHLVPAGVVPAPERELLPVPVAVEVRVVLEGGHLEELVLVVARPVDRVLGRAVAERERRDLLQRLLEAVTPEHRGVPGNVYDSGHQAPTSARIAPGPSAVAPRPSASAPTRMAILPRCSFLYIDWWASATPSNVMVFHNTGRILPDSINSF